MSTLTADEIHGPALAGARPRVRPKGFFEQASARRRELFPGTPLVAYDQGVVSRWTPFGRIVFVHDPAGVKRVLVDNVANYPKTEMEKRAFVALFGNGLLGTDGELWRTHRRIMAPAFQPASVEGYGPAMAAESAKFVTRWQARNAPGPVDMSAEMSLLTLKIIARTMFSTESDEVIGMVAKTMSDGLGGFAFGALDFLPVIGPRRMRERVAHMEALFAPLDGVVAEMIAAREADPNVGAGDLLSRLVAAKDSETGAKMTAREVRDQVITIFIAGHETTAVAMSWIWYLLSQHPDAEAKLHAELAAVLGGRTPTQEDIAALPYTRQVVEEAMRLYPPAPGISTRETLADDEICGVPVKKGANIIIAPWILQRRAALWEEPERFDPDRFSPERSKGRHRFAYLPFGAGPRICIGQLMAMNETILILAALAQHFSPRLAPGAKVKLERNVTLRAVGLQMNLAPR